MSIDRMIGRQSAIKDLKSVLDATIKHLDEQSKEKPLSDFERGMKSGLQTVGKVCDQFIDNTEENISGEMERMHEMMEGKKDDRQDHRDL